MYSLLTTDDADEVLPEDWVDLDEEVKERHISQASLYVRARWICAGVDWDTSPVLQDDIKYGIARYAYHDFKGELYPAVRTGIKRKKSKVEGLEQEIEYSAPFRESTLAYLDDIFNLSCSKKSTSSVVLTRV